MEIILALYIVWKFILALYIVWKFILELYIVWKFILALYIIYKLVCKSQRSCCVISDLVLGEPEGGGGTAAREGGRSAGRGEAGRGGAGEPKFEGEVGGKGAAGSAAGIVGSLGGQLRAG